MSCYFHQNIAYIAFKSDAHMHSVCQLRLYTEDDRLLSERSCINRKYDQLVLPQQPHPKHYNRAISTHTDSPPDTSSLDQSNTRSLRRSNSYLYKQNVNYSKDSVKSVKKQNDIK